LAVSSYAPVFLLTLFGSLAAGVACAYALQPLLRGLRDVPTSLIVQFSCTFGGWIAAEAIGLSGILTLVAFAMRWRGVRSRRAVAGAHAHPDPRGMETVVFRAQRVRVRVDRMQLRRSGRAGCRRRARRRVVTATVGWASQSRAALRWVMSYNALRRWRHDRADKVSSGGLEADGGRRHRGLVGRHARIVTLARGVRDPRDAAERVAISVPRP